MTDPDTEHDLVSHAVEDLLQASFRMDQLPFGRLDGYGLLKVAVALAEWRDEAVAE